MYSDVAAELDANFIGTYGALARKIGKSERTHSMAVGQCVKAYSKANPSWKSSNVYYEKDARKMLKKEKKNKPKK